MIVNFEKASQVYGGSEEMVKSEMLQFVNFVSPRHIEDIVSAHCNRSFDQVLRLTRDHLGATR